MVKIRNKTGVCCHPDCDTPVSQDEILCPEHKHESEQADLLIRADEQAQGWPETQFEEGDA